MRRPGANGTPVPSGEQCTIQQVRLLSLLGLAGLWSAASALGGPLVVTALFTAGAAALGIWALATLRQP